MTITDQQREDAFVAASETQKELYDSEESAQKLLVIAKQHNLSEQNVYLDFLIAVGDVVLGLVPQEQLPQLLVERLSVTQATAMRTTADLLDFLEPLQHAATAVPIKNAAPVVVNPTTTEQPKSLENEIAEAEAAFHQLQPIRTMAGDMQALKHEEPAHQAATQDELLKGDGNGKKNPGAQWGTGQ